MLLPQYLVVFFTRLLMQTLIKLEKLWYILKVVIMSGNRPCGWSTQNYRNKQQNIQEVSLKGWKVHEQYDQNKNKKDGLAGDFTSMLWWDFLCHTGSSEAQLWHAVLLVPDKRPDSVFWTQASDHRPRLLVRREAETQLSRAAGLLQDQLHLQVGQCDLWVMWLVCVLYQR